MADLTESQKEAYWRYNITLTTILLIVWFVVTYIISGLMAGWLNPMRCPARVTLRSCIMASKTTSRFKSKARQFTQRISQCRECIPGILTSAVPWGSWTGLILDGYPRGPPAGLAARCLDVS